MGCGNAKELGLMNAPEDHPRGNALRGFDQILDDAGIVTERCVNRIDIGQKAVDAAPFWAKRPAKPKIGCDDLMSACAIAPIPDISIKAFDQCFGVCGHPAKASGSPEGSQRG